MLRAGTISHELPALWLRERSPDPSQFDPITSARVVNSYQWPADLRIEVAMQAGDTLSVRFSDGHVADYSLSWLRHEITALTVVPARLLWRNELSPLPYHMFSHLSSPSGLASAIGDLLRYGIVILTGVPVDPGSVATVAKSFGSLRDSQLGAEYSVNPHSDRDTHPQSAHPFGSPTQSYVLTHCLNASVPNGEFSLVDGLSVVDRLRREDGEGCRLLSTTDVTYRYTDTQRDHHITRPLLSLDRRGRITSIHHNPFHVELPLMSLSRTLRYHAARQRFSELVNSGGFTLSVPLVAGNLVVTDNRTVLLGTAAHEPGVSLQQCTIDADGPPSTFRLLAAMQP
jgi:gamma-butyrobetaine dioxygenase